MSRDYLILTYQRLLMPSGALPRWLLGRDGGRAAVGYWPAGTRAVTDARKGFPP